MNFKIRFVIVTVLVMQFLSGPALAQERSTFPNLRRNAATVIFCGLGGAVLGLSTLSFYGKPQDHMGNIYLGLGAGLILGSGYVYYKSLPQIEESQTILRLRLPKSQQPIQFAYAWDF